MNPLMIPVLSDRQEENFWNRIAMIPSDCWLWTGRINADGYGEVDLGNKRFLAHRVMYFLHYRINPGDQLVCHTCDNPMCVNPDHLFLGSSQDNVQDSVNKGTHSSVTLLGEDRPNSKLTEEIVLKIRFEILFFSASELSRKYKIHVTTVYQIINRVTWKHI